MYSAWQPPTNSLCGHEVWYPARQIAQVLSEAKKEPMTNCPDLMSCTSAPVSSTTPTYSWPIGVGADTGLMPR